MHQEPHPLQIITIKAPSFVFYKKNYLKTTTHGHYHVKISPLLTKVVVIPLGFVSDGASIPRLFWPLVGGRFSDANGEAAILHDYLYFTGFNRAIADDLFFHLMRQHGGFYLACLLKWMCVRAFGWIAYKNHRRAAKK